MNICFVVNDNYAIYLYVAIKSILNNALNSDVLHFYIFNPDLSQTTKDELYKLQLIHNFDIEFITIDDENELPDFPVWTAYNSKLAHYRFKIPEKMKERGVERYLYLDADIIVNGSLAKLYNTDMGGKAVALVPSPLGLEEKTNIASLKLSINHKYAYSGLMLVDVKLWTKQGMYKKICEIARAKGHLLYWPDMDILNLTLADNNYYQLLPKWSINPGFYGFCDENHFFEAYENIFDREVIEEAIKSPVIWQLAGGAKPFTNVSLPKIKKIFYNYTKGSIFKKQAKKWLPPSWLNRFWCCIWHVEKKEQQFMKFKYYKLFNKTVFIKKKKKPLSLKNLVILNSDRLLCICPHADDEMIGLGGLIIQRSSQFDVLCLNSSGVAYKNRTAKEQSSIRVKEFASVMKKLGVNNYWIFEGYGKPPMYHDIDGHFDDYLTSVNLSDYDYIFIPYVDDSHPEHQYASRHVFPAMCKRQGLKKSAKIVMYEVWTPLERPNLFLDIENEIPEKVDILKMYKSQLVDGWNYDHWVMGLNSYRSMQSKLGGVATKYAEVFEEVSVDDYLRMFS